MEEIEDIINDHREMIEEAIKQGLNEEQIPLRFGDPKVLAKELAENINGNGTSEEKRTSEQEDTDGLTLWKEFTPDQDTLKIMIGSISEDYIVQASPDDKIRIYYEGRGNINHYDVSYRNGEFRFEAPKFKGGLIFMRKQDDLDFVFEFPKELHVTESKFVSLSGDLIIKNLQTEQSQINITSGDITVEGCNLGNTKWNTVSGDLLIKNVALNGLSSSQVSGDLDMEHTEIQGDVHMNTVSGDLHFKDVKAKNVEFSSVSGDVNGVEFYPEVIRFKSVSGDLAINNKTKTSIHLEKVSTLSGTVDIH
jgi:hypothetical protein